MLKKFSVNNFKNFKTKTVFDLGNPLSYEFNEELIKSGCVTKAVVLGINGSGKSNLGLAIFDIIFHLTDKEKLVNRYLPYLHMDSKRNIAEFEYEFVFDGVTVQYKYGKKSPFDLVYECLYIDGEEVVNYDFRDNSGFTSLKGAETLNLVSSQNNISRVKYIKGNAILVEDDLKNKVFYSFMDFVDKMLMFYSLDERGYQGFFLGADSFTQGIIRAGKTKEFEKFLRDNDIDYNLVEREINGTKELYCHFEKGDVNFSSIVSTGTRALALFYYWYIKLQDVSFVYIDEFDAFYHFELSKKLIMLLKTLPDTQVVVTSHNTDLLSNDLLRPDCYYQIIDSKIKTFAESTDKDIRRAHNIQKMYKAGSFNG